MDKRVITLAVMACTLTLSLPAFGQDTGKKERPGRGPAAPKMASGPGTGMPAAVRPNFGLISGTISKIDTSDPANVKLEVKGEGKEQTHTIYTTPWTNVTKLTDVSELKTGDFVRIMARSAEDKTTAMNIMFGNVKRAPGPNPMMMPTPPSKGEGSAKK